MANYQDTQFKSYAGQLVKDGIATNQPMTPLEASETTAQNLSNINGLMPTVKDILIRDTRVFAGNNLDRYFTKWYQRFGGVMEQAMFDPGIDKKLDGTCMPRGSPDLYSQLNAVNFSMSYDVDINDHEVDYAVLDEGQLGSYVAAKLRTPLAGMAIEKYIAEKQIISDVISGTRTLSSTTQSDGQGASVTYNPNITGYAGVVEDAGVVIPSVERGSLVAIPSVEDALNIYQTLQGRAADMDIPASDMNSSGATTFNTSDPLLIMETKTLNALDNIFRNPDAANNAAVMGTSFRSLVGNFSTLVEIDSFASLPTNSSYSNKRLGAVLIDRDAPIENVKWNDMESFRCSKARSTGYNWQYNSILSIGKMLNSYAMLFSQS